MDDAPDDIIARVRFWLHRLENKTRGRMSADQLIDQWERGHQLLWVVIEPSGTVTGVIGATIHNTGWNERFCKIGFVVGRDVRSWGDEALAEIEGFAHHVGCTWTEAVMRFGLAPIFERAGYKADHVRMSKRHA